MKNKKSDNKAIIYQATNGAIELRGDLVHETMWATQVQISEIFGTERSVVTKHIKNIFKDKEVLEKSNVQKMHIAKSDKPVSIYSLDIILAVGYRTNSARAIQFRQWATKTLRQHLTKGYTINRKQIGQNYTAFIKAVGDVQALLPQHITLDPGAVLDLVKEFASTFMSLDAYDKDSLSTVGSTKKSVKLNSAELQSAIGTLRAELVKKKEATGIFAQERREGSIEGIIGSVMQSFGGKQVYETVEEKAAHLLYFMVKNHPFVDGNKRSGAFAFVWFLRKVNVKGGRNINPTALTALTLLVAESKPSDKNQVIGLIILLLKK